MARPGLAQGLPGIVKVLFGRPEITRLVGDLGDEGGDAPRRVDPVPRQRLVQRIDVLRQVRDVRGRDGLAQPVEGEQGRHGQGAVSVCMVSSITWIMRGQLTPSPCPLPHWGRGIRKCLPVLAGELCDPTYRRST